MRTTAMVFLGIFLVLPGCVGQLLEPGDDDDDADDDAGDDDASGDDDVGDDDAGDDDVGDDDVGDDDVGDDDVGDDDVGDDDVGDDDVGDDDTGDDDTSPPPPPGIIFDVLSGPLADHYAFHNGVSCYPDYGGWTVEAAQDNSWSEYFYLWIDGSPGVGSHFEGDFAAGGELGGYYVERWPGGWDCYLDIVSNSPDWNGTFECHGLEGWDPNGGQFSVDAVNGWFLCP